MTNKLNLQELTSLLEISSELTKEEAETFVQELFNIIEQGLAHDELVKVKDFGTFKLTPIRERESVDVNTQEKIMIPAHRRVSFLPAQSLKNLVNKPFAHFETTPLNDDIFLENVEQDEPSDSMENEGDEEFVAESDKSIEDEVDKIESHVETESKNELETTDLSEISEVADSDLANIESIESKSIAYKDSSEEETDSKTITFPPIVSIKKANRKRKNRRFLLWIYTSTALIITIALISAYNFYIKKNNSLKEEIEDSETSKMVEETTPILKDSSPTLQPTPSVESTETVEMIRGKTLRLIALDKFGSREFWIYIYLKNKDKIKNPDVVPIGLKLILPRKTDYAMNAKNPEDVANAKKLGDEEMKKYW